MSKETYIGPVTGREYNLAAGERIDAEAEGLGYTGDKASPLGDCQRQGSV